MRLLFQHSCQDVSCFDDSLLRTRLISTTTTSCEVALSPTLTRHSSPTISILTASMLRALALRRFELKLGSRRHNLAGLVMDLASYVREVFSVRFQAQPESQMHPRTAVGGLLTNSHPVGEFLQVFRDAIHWPMFSTTISLAGL